MTGSEERRHSPEAEVEAELLRACQDGDTRMYAPIVRAYEARALRFAMGMLGDGDLARDATQDAFVTAFRKLDRFELGRPFGPWFFRILRNSCIDELRRAKARTRAESAVEALDVTVHGRVPGTDRHVRRREAAAVLWAALEKISPDHREALVLREIEGYSYDEMAARLEVPEGTIASRLFHARRALREALEEMGVHNMEALTT